MKKKIIKKTKRIFLNWELLNEHMDKTRAGQILNSWEIDLLERRKEVLKRLSEAKEDLRRINESVDHQQNILDVKDTPQGTQLVKCISGSNFFKFHYV